MPTSRSWARRPTGDAASKRRQQDYNSTQHKRLRAKYQPLIDSGHGQCCEAVCVHPTRAITAGATWHLAHTADRTGYLGPAHPRCNLAAAARAGNQAQRQAMGKPTRRQSRRW